MREIETRLPDVRVFDPDFHGDHRGFFMEVFRESKYQAHGLRGPWVQDNMAGSGRGVLRGLHYQWPDPQGKLVWVVHGEVLDVAVDIRHGSPTFGQHHSQVLSAKNRLQMWVPEGFAHGYLVLAEGTVFCYKVTAEYEPAHDRGIRWNDPSLGIRWPNDQPKVSQKDEANPLLADMPPELLPPYQA